jgi:hypothetical protein
VKDLIIQQVNRSTSVDQQRQQEQLAQTSTSEGEPSAKRPCVLTTYSKLLQEAGAHVSEDREIGSTQLDLNLVEPLIQLGKEDPFHWWSKNQKRFPQLAKIAQKYLSAPPSSVASERLFSGAGDVYDDKRNKLAPEKAEMLLFIKNNFKMC